MVKKRVKKKTKKTAKKQEKIEEGILEKQQREAIEQDVIRQIAKKHEFIKNFEDIKVIHEKSEFLALTEIEEKELIINTGCPVLSNGEIIGSMGGIIIHENGHLDERLSAPANTDIMKRDFETMKKKRIPESLIHVLHNIVTDLEIHYQYNKRRMVRPSQSHQLRRFLTLARNYAYEKSPDAIFLSMEYPKTPEQQKIKEIISNRSFNIAEKCEEVYKVLKKSVKGAGGTGKISSKAGGKGKKGKQQGGGNQKKMRELLKSITKTVYKKKQKKARSILKDIKKEVKKQDVERQLSQLGFSGEEIAELVKKYDRDDLVDRVSDLSQCFKNIVPIFNKETTRKDVKKRLKSSGSRMIGYRKIRDYDELVDNPEELINALYLEDIYVPHKVDIGRSGTIAILRDTSGSVSSSPIDKYVRDITVSLVKLAKKERHMVILCDFHSQTEFIKDSKGRVKTDRYNELLLESMRFKEGYSTVLSEAVIQTVNLIGSEKATIYVVSDSYVDRLNPKYKIPKNIKVNGIWVGDGSYDKDFSDVIRRGRGKMYHVYKDDENAKKLITEVVKEF